MFMLCFLSLLPLCLCPFSSSSSQTLTEPTNFVFAVDITGNGEFAIVGSWDNSSYVYVNNGTHFDYSYNLPGCCPHWVDEIDVTADGEWLYVVPAAGNSSVYRYNFTTNRYELSQTLNLTYLYNQAGAITDDHQWLIVPQDDGWVYIYTFNGS